MHTVDLANKLENSLEKFTTIIMAGSEEPSRRRTESLLATTTVCISFDIVRIATSGMWRKITLEWEWNTRVGGG